MRDGAGWKVISAAGTVHGDTTLAGKASLAPQEAVQRRGGRCGRATLARPDRPGRQDRRRGLQGIPACPAWPTCSARDLVAFPTVERGFVPAYETIVLDMEGAEPAAYRTFVDEPRRHDPRPRGHDGQRGRRAARLQPAQAQAAALAAPQAFTGELPAADGGCAPQHGPYAVAAGAGVRAIDVLAQRGRPDAGHRAAAITAGRRSSAKPTPLTTPERIRYAPAGGVPAGDYFVEVCEFRDGAPPVEPRTYSGTITLDDSAPPAPYTARWRDFGATPLHNTLAMGPVEQPGHGHPRGLVLEGERERRRLRRGGRQPHHPRAAVGPRRQGEHEHEHDDRQQRQHGGGVDEPDRPSALPIGGGEPGVAPDCGARVAFALSLSGRVCNRGALGVGVPGVATAGGTPVIAWPFGREASRPCSPPWREADDVPRGAMTGSAALTTRTFRADPPAPSAPRPRAPSTSARAAGLPGDSPRAARRCSNDAGPGGGGAFAITGFSSAARGGTARDAAAPPATLAR